MEPTTQKTPSLRQQIESHLDAFEETTLRIKDAIDSLQLLQNLFQNIVSNPSEQVYRRVKTKNSIIATSIFEKWSDATDFFKLLGFNEEGDQFLVLPESDAYPQLNSAISIIKERVKLDQEIFAESEEAQRQKQQALLKQQQQKEALRQKMAAQSVIHINGQSDFQQQVLNSTKPVIVDFYADWCPPCRQLASLFDSEIQSSNGWILAKVKSDEASNQPISQSHGIQGIPAVFLYHKGKMISEVSFTGFNPPALMKMIQKALSLL